MPHTWHDTNQDREIYVSTIGESKRIAVVWRKRYGKEHWLTGLKTFETEEAAQAALDTYAAKRPHWRRVACCPECGAKLALLVCKHKMAGR